MLGAHADYQQNIYSADMTGLPGTPSCCPHYTNGSGAGFALGALFELPLADAWVLQFRAGYAVHNGTLTDNESQTVLVGNDVIPALVEHRIDAHISTVGIEPLAGFFPLERLGVYIGGRLAYVAHSLFDQKETLVQPAGVGTFENLSRTRNVYTAVPIPDAATVYAGLLGLVSYRLPLSRSGVWWLVPELSYTVGLSKISTSRTWSSGNARAGVSVQYAFLPEVAPPPPPPPAPLPPKELRKPRLAASIAAKGIDAQGRATDDARITVEEFESMQVRPLLSYVFFDSASSRIPARYPALHPDETATYSMDRLHESAGFDAYYNLLNIVGLRMREHPAAGIRVTGCNAASGAEAGNLALSRSRAEAVADYLATVWGIERKRIAIDARGLPENPSRSDDPDGIPENRRVEIAADDDAILDPLVTHSIERRVTPDIIRFLPDAQAEAGVQSWRIDVLRGGATVRSWSGSGEPKPEVDWHFADDLPGLSTAHDTLRYRFTVTDAEQQLRESRTGTIDVREITVRRKRETRVADRTISRFDLILFDFNSPQLGRRNERIVSEFIRPEITPESNIRIYGYTDRMGEENYNRVLSQHRAESAARALHSKAGTVEGKGETSPLYNNDLPEGRFYNRTVEIEVENPTR